MLSNNAGTADSDGPGKIAWDVVCKRKAAGGLGVKDIIKWNQSALFKHIWAVENKKDNMWVRWVHHLYMKSSNI